MRALRQTTAVAVALCASCAFAQQSVWSEFGLGKLTYSLDTGLWTNLDCTDFATTDYLACVSHGTGGDVLWLEDLAGDGFHTNSLCRAGEDASVFANYNTRVFNYHCLYQGSLTYDCAVSYLYDPWANLTMDPAVEWTLPAHYQNQVGGSWYGLVGPTQDPPASTSQNLLITYLSPFPSVPSS